MVLNFLNYKQSERDLQGDAWAQVVGASSASGVYACDGFAPCVHLLAEFFGEGCFLCGGGEGAQDEEAALGAEVEVFAFGAEAGAKAVGVHEDDIAVVCIEDGEGDFFFSR